VRSHPFGFVLALVLAQPAAAHGQAIAILNQDIKELEAIARADTNDAELQYYLALGYWKRHRWQQADSLLRLTVRLEPRYAEAYLALYYLPFARRTTLFREYARDRVPEDWRPAVAEAVGFYQRAFRTNPLVSLRVMAVAFEIEEPRFSDYTSPYYREYELYYAWFVDLGLGRYRTAHDRLVRLAEREFDGTRKPEKVPDFILWYRGLAAAHSRQFDLAIADFQALLDRTLKHTERNEIVRVPLRDNEYRFMLAALHHAAGNAQRAASLYQEALEHDLGLVMAHTYLAALYETADMGEEALLERQRAAEINSDDPTALFDLAVSLFNTQRSAEAEEHIRRAIEVNPRYSPSYYILGRIAQEQGRGEEARGHFTRFLSLAPQRLRELRADAEQRLAAR
jgi:tetratricopeptide (TPR) repeat protein